MVGEPSHKSGTGALTQIHLAASDSHTRRVLDFSAIALALCGILVQGNRFGLGNQELILTAIRRLNDPTWLVNDWFLTTPPHHPFLVSLLAIGARWLGEAAFLLLLHVLTRFLLLAATWRLADALLPGRPLVALLAMAGVIFEPRFQLGSHYLQGGHWEVSFLGGAFAVAILAQGIRWAEGRGSAVVLTLVAGAGILAHFFINLPLALLVIAAGALRRHQRLSSGAGPRARASALEPLLVALGALFLGSPAWLGAAISFLFPGEAPLSGAEVIHVLQFRHPHHHQPWLWPAGHWLQGGALLLAGAVGWCVYLRGDGRRRLLIPAVYLGWFLLSCAAFVAAGWKGVLPALAYLQPFRVISLFFLLAMILAVALVEDLLSRWRWPAVAAGAVVVFLLWRLVPLSGPFLLAFYIAYFTLAGRRGGGGGVSLPGRRLMAAMIAAAAVIGGGGILLFQFHGPSRSLANSLRSGHWLVEAEPRDVYRRELTGFIRAETPSTAVFAIPPAMEHFRLWEHRAIVVDLKSVPYRNADLAVWAERISLGTNAVIFEHAPRLPGEDVSASQLVLLAHTYGARFVVAREQIHHSTVVFRNERYTVLDLERDEITLPR